MGKSQKEAQIEKNVCAYANSLGCYVRKFVSPGRRGAPDHYFLTPGGTSFFIEFKRHGEEPGPMQARELREINKRGGRGYWTDNEQGGKIIVENMCALDLI